MKKNLLSVLAALWLLPAIAAYGETSVSEEADVHRFATFNVRYVNSSNGDTGDKLWANRKSYVGRIVTDYDFDIVGMQEVTGNNRDEVTGKSQLDDLRDMLPDYTSWAVERSGRQYEYNVLFFKTEKYQLIEKGYFYLNEHPDTPGAGWNTTGDLQPRVLAWAHLRDKATAKDFFFAVTHVNYGATVSGIESCRLIGRRLHELCGGVPVVLVGDFNMRRVDHSDAWRGVASYLSDAALCTSTTCLPKGKISHTASNWLPATDEGCKGSEFDYVFFRRMIPLSRHIITEDYDRAVTPSDHFPLLVRFRFAEPDAVLQQDSRGVYQLSTAADLRRFSDLVREGDAGAEAELTADVDMSSVSATWQPIGTSGKPFVGRFDGRNHMISGFSRTTSADGDGLFGLIRGATVENFTLKGRLIAQHKRCGVVGHCASAVITNVHSVLNVDAWHANASHTAGVVGYAQDKTLVSRCSFSGTVSVGDTNYDCFGGVCAYTNTACFTDCANYGSISFAKDDCYAGGVVGYVNNGNFPGLHNCLNVGRVRFTGEGRALYGGALVGWLRNHNANLMGQNYWLSSSASAGSGERTDDGFHGVSLAQLRSGEIAWLLNDSCETSGPWYQTIGQDAYPVLNDTHLSVIRMEDGTFANPVGIESVRLDSETTCDAVYDLCGRQLSAGRRPKGVYVMKGRKVVF